MSESVYELSDTVLEISQFFQHFHCKNHHIHRGYFNKLVTETVNVYYICRMNAHII